MRVPKNPGGAKSAASQDVQRRKRALDLQHRKVIGWVASHDARGKLASLGSHADLRALCDHMVGGDEVSIGGDKEPGSGGRGFGGLLRDWLGRARNERARLELGRDGLRLGNLLKGHLFREEIAEVSCLFVPTGGGDARPCVRLHEVLRCAVT